MRTCYTGLLLGCFVGLGALTASAAAPHGVAFAGDLQSIDRAVLESAQLPLPSVGAAPTTRPRTAPAAYHQASSIRSTMPATRVTPAAYDAGLRPQTGPQTGDSTASKESKPSFLGRMKPSWLFGKKQASSMPAAADPFATATRDARIELTGAATKRARGRVTPIPAYVPTKSKPAARSAVRTPQPQIAAATQQPNPAANSRGQNGGLSLRNQSAPRRGLLSGLWGDSTANPNTMPAGTTPARVMAAKSMQPKASGMASSYASDLPRTSRPANKLRSQATAPKPQAIASLGAAPRPKPLAKKPAPMPRSIAKAAPVATPNSAANPFFEEKKVMVKAPAPKPSPAAVAKTTPTPKPPKKLSEPAASAILISDANPPVPSVPADPAEAPIVESVAPKAPVMESLAMTAPAAEPKTLNVPKVVAKPAPVVANLAAKPLPSTPQPYRQPPAPRPYVVTDMETLAAAPLAPGSDAEPSERSRALLTEAHGLAAHAVNAEDYSAVLKRCRYVMAIDNSSQAQAYANQLAGWALTKRGEVFEEVGRLEEAAVDYEEALRSDRECWRAEHALGVLAARKGDAEEALIRFNRTLDLNPEFAKAYSNRAALSVQKGDYSGSLLDYKRAIEINPDLAVAHTGRGRVCHMLGMLDEGLQHLDAAEILSPDDAMISTGRGDLLVDLGRYGQAAQAYERAIRLAPESPVAYRNLAWMQATCPVETFRDGEAALANAEQAEQLAAGADDLTLDTKAAALAAMGRFDEATALQRWAIEISPDTDASVYEERLAMYEQGQSFTSRPVAVRQASYRTPSRTR